MRDDKVYICDIVESLAKIEKYTKTHTETSFVGDDMAVDAVCRNLEIVGEAAKKISPDFRKEHKHIEWKKIAGLRDVLIHEYSNIDLDMIWQIVRQDVPQLLKEMRGLK